MDASEKAFISQSEFYVDRAARIRMNEEVNKDIRDTMHAMNDKLDARLKWIIGIFVITMSTLLSNVFIPITLHVLRLN